MRIPAALLLFAGTFAIGCPDDDPGACIERDGGIAADLCNSCSCIMGGWWVTQKACANLLPVDGTAQCYTLGLGDVLPETPGLQVTCTAVLERADAGTGFVVETLVPLCVAGPDGPTWPENADTCVELRTNDAVSAECVAERGELFAMEAVAIFRPGTEVAGDAIAVSCTPPEPLCPGPEQTS